MKSNPRKTPDTTMPRSCGLKAILCTLCLALAAAGALAQSDESDHERDAVPEPAPGQVRLNFPENLALKVLIDYVGERRGINFIYDPAQLQNKTITLKTPMEVPSDSLTTMLGGVLKLNGLVMTETDIEGTIQIQRANAALSGVAGGLAPERAAAQPRALSSAVTRVFEFRHASAERIEQVMQPFLSDPQASITTLPGHGLAIVTDYASNMARLERLLGVIDRPGREVGVRFIEIKHLDATEVQQKATELLKGKAAAHGGEETAGGVTVLAVAQTNRIAVVGSVDRVEEVVQVIDTLDMPLQLETRIYEFQIASPEEVDQLIQSVIGEVAAAKFYKSAPYERRNLLIATTTVEIHQQIEALQARIDQPMAESQNPIRFYKLENADAVEVLNTLKNIEGTGGMDGVSLEGASTAEQATEPTYTQRGPTEAEINRQNDGNVDEPASMNTSSLTASVEGTRIMVHEPTNTIIVIATPSMHSIYAELIGQLDVRQPQVLIEATVVVVDTTDDFSLGVEIHTREDVDGGMLLNFTKFGVTTANSVPGDLTLSPGTGFNGALLDAATAEVVINAVQTDSRARIVSRPSVLINDNAEGILKSQQREPYESVNASDTVATTTLGGYVDAGTTIQATPQISEGDHLKLVYKIELSSFGEDRTTSLPPSLQTDSLESVAMIPNGYTIVVGGLTRNNFTKAKASVPILGDIPLVEYLFSDRQTTSTQQTLFVFLRAVILRDDKFKDLRLLSTEAIDQSSLSGEHPSSEPVTVK